MLKITKEQVFENLKECKDFIIEIEAEQKIEGKKKVVIEIKNRFTGTIIFTSEKITIKEAIQDNKADLRGADLRGANLREANLYGANLREADLREADLYEADLRGADLYGADLRGADLYEADLRGADLRGADLINAKFYGKGGTTKIKKSDLDDFLKALGIIMED